LNSIEKGKKGEREFANLCKAEGYNTRRSQQYCGVAGDADVIGLPFLHVEVKRVERLNIYDAMAQAISNKKEGELPVVAHRKNHCDWLITMRFSEWIELYREWEAGRGDSE
jgi:Holliday junction resolvase